MMKVLWSFKDKASDTVVIQPADKQQEDNQQPSPSLPAAVLAGQPLKPSPGQHPGPQPARTCVIPRCVWKADV